MIKEHCAFTVITLCRIRQGDRYLCLCLYLFLYVCVCLSLTLFFFFFQFFLAVYFRPVLSNVQKIIANLYSGISSGIVLGPYEMPSIQYKLATFNATILPTVLCSQDRARISNHLKIINKQE